MKTTIKLMTVTAALILSTMAFGQMDKERMERDLKVAVNILNTLSNDGTRGMFGSDVESTYIKDYGVVFTLPTRSFILRTGREGTSYVFSGGNEAVSIVKEKSKGKSGYVVKSKSISSTDSDLDEESIIEELEANTREKMTTFLADYADLIGQLEPSDRIIVQTSSNTSNFEMWNSEVCKCGSGNISAQLMKGDLIDYKKGKIGRDELIGRIKFTESEAEDIAKDVELFATLFARLYQPDMSSTYYSASRNIRYSKIQNIGLTFNMKMYSSSVDDGVYTIRTTGQSDLTQEERNKIVDEMYPNFLQSFKENIVDYARTIRSLDENELLIFKVKLTECRDCKMPDTIEVTIKGQALKAFDSGELSREQAVSEVSVKEIKG